MSTPINIPLLDLSYLYELAGDDDQYIEEVIQLFIGSAPAKMIELDHKISYTEDFVLIRELAHFLKSSATIIKIRDMHDNLSRIETLAKAATGRDEMLQLIKELKANFSQAMPLILAEEKRVQKKLR